MSTAKALFLAAASPTVVGVEVAGALALLPPPDELGTNVTALEDDDAAAAAPPALRDDRGARRATAACALALLPFHSSRSFLRVRCCCLRRHV